MPLPDSYDHAGQGIYHKSEQAAAHAQNTLKNPHYADPSQPLNVEQDNARIDEPGYADWEYAFPESYDVATIGGGAEHLYFYHADHLGSTGYVTRADALVIEHVQYFPFGETWVQQSGNTEKYPYLFTSKEFDEETGLYYFGARYYDPRTSVWQSADPVLGEYLPNQLDKKQQEKDWKPEKDLLGKGGVYNGRNLGLYAYALNNPLVIVDPDGNSPVEDFMLHEGAPALASKLTELAGNASLPKLGVDSRGAQIISEAAAGGAEGLIVGALSGSAVPGVGTAAGATVGLMAGSTAGLLKGAIRTGALYKGSVG